MRLNAARLLRLSGVLGAVDIQYLDPYCDLGSSAALSGDTGSVKDCGV